jgi:uncharacterized membrane protein YfcA
VTRGSLPVLAGIGIAGGLLGGLFGVGGGIVVVPLLILLVGLDAKEATATSLAAIGLTAIFGVIVFSIFGHIAWRDAALIGLAAMVGTFAGTELQRRISSQLLTYLFAGFIVLVAVRLWFE